MSSNLNEELDRILTEYSKVNYTEPKIYHGGESFDLSKRWYVYYSYRHPDTGEMIKQPPVYYHVNRDFKTKPDRMARLRQIRDGLKELLKSGYSPYSNANHSPLLHKSSESLDYALRLKFTELNNPKTRKDYENRLDHFKKYLEIEGLSDSPITSITRKVVKDFLADMMLRSNGKGVKNRNNTKAVISSLFSVLEDQEIIPNNFVLNIKNLKHSPERHRTYSNKKADDIIEWLDRNKPVLSLFIKVICYNFLRPVEACRIRMGDIDLDARLFVFKAKNKSSKYKRIPDIIFPEIASLDCSNPDYFLFTPCGPGAWEANEQSRREYFTAEYRKVKEKFSLGAEHTIYSFRHTFITRTYRNFREVYSVTETLDNMMGITGHHSLQGLKNYLRDIDAEIPKDWSDWLR